MSDAAPDRILWPHVTPYEVQRLAVDAAEQALAQEQSALVVLPTGLGKTICVAELARRYVEERDERVLVIAHTEELIDQSADKIARFGFGESDGRTHLVGVEMAERAVDIGGMFAPQVIVASVQSMCRDTRLARFPADTFGLVVVDEVHHGTAVTYRKVIDYFTGVVRDENGLVIERAQRTHILGVTATPDRRDGRALGDVLARVAFEYETRDAIRDGHLVPLRAKTGVLPQIDCSRIGEVAGDLNQGELDEAVIAMIDEAAMAIADRIGTRRGIAFLPSVDSALVMADALRALGLSAEGLSGRDNQTARQSGVDKFRDGSTQILCNCALFTEGFDVPEVSLIAILRPTTSRALFSQMIGRGLRLAPWVSKQDCLILDFPGVGWNGRKGHDLANPFDALGGITDDDIARRAAKLLEDTENADFMEVMDRAAQQVEGEREQAAEGARLIRAKRAKQEQDLDLLGRDKKNQAPWVAELRDVWGLYDGTKPRKPDEMPRDPVRAAAILAKLRERKRLGLCTWPQARVLRRNRLPTTIVPKRVASRWIDGIAAAGWKSVPASVRAEAEQYWPGDVTRQAKP